MRNLEFDASAFEDLAWWIEKDRAQALRIVKLVREIQRDPYSGPGNPEPLKHELSGCWSDASIENIGSSITCRKTRSEFSPAGSTTNPNRRHASDHVSSARKQSAAGGCAEHYRRMAAAGRPRMHVAVAIGGPRHYVLRHPAVARTWMK